jgi:transposase
LRFSGAAALAPTLTFLFAAHVLAGMAGAAKAPIAIEAVQKIDVLFSIEREINGKPAAERLAVRQEPLRLSDVSLDGEFEQHTENRSR